MHGIDILGFLAAIVGTITNLPQLIKAIKTKQTQDVSLWTYLLLDAVTIMWLIYGIVLRQTPLIVNGILVLITSGMITYLKIKHG